MAIDFARAQAELPILRDFVDFVNSQVGVYMDCLAGFRGNTARVERQVARVLKPVARQVRNGQPVMVYSSVEDPSSPQAIHHRIIRADDFLAANGEAGFNRQHVCWSVIVFLFAYWDEAVRPQIATVRGTKPQDVTVDALGDLRLIRNAIIHNKGVLSSVDHAKLKKMGALMRPNAAIAPTHDEMHNVFVAVKQAIGEIILTYSGHLPGAPDASEIVDVAIATSGLRKEGDEE